MTAYTSKWRTPLLAAAVGGLLAAPWPAWAQQPAAQPLPPGSPFLGQPDTEAAKNLRPVAAPPLPTALDKLPTDKLIVPKG